MEFKCDRCGHATNRKQTLQQHLQTKKPCQEIYSNQTRESLLKKLEKQYNSDAKQCQWCAKKFNSASNFSTHKKTCKQKPTVTEHDNGEASGSQQPSPSDSTTNHLLKHLITLMEKLVDKPAQSSNNYIQINQQNNQNNNNIILNSLGKESLAHLTDEKMSQFIQNREIIDLIKTISFNPDVPENHNIKRITSSKDWYKNQFLSVYNENGEWTNNVKEKVLETVVNNGFKVMYKHFFDTIQSNPMNVTEESVEFTKWFNENFTNPKNFTKQVFAMTLDDKFLAKNES
jgi:hypothetical protein